MNALILKKRLFLLFSLLLPFALHAEDRKGLFYDNPGIWKQTDYLWSLSFLFGVNQTYFSLPGSPFHTSPRTAFLIKENDVVFVGLPFLRQFARSLFPRIHCRFTLVTGFSDISFPSYFSKDTYVIDMLKSENILHIYAQNFDRTDLTEKTTPLPLGIDFQYTSLAVPEHEKHSRTPQQNELLFKECIKNAPYFSGRLVKVIADFHLHNSSRFGPWGRYFKEDRQAIYEQLKETTCIDFIKYRIPRVDLWKKKTAYLFSISPVGQGLDCHRTWEDLALGLIVIVKSSPLDPLYKDLPVVIVKDWREITEENLYRWKEQFEPLLASGSYIEKLKASYWINVVHGK